MVCEVDHCCLVGGRFIIDPQFIVIGQSVCNRNRQVAWIAFLAIFAEIAERETRAVFGIYFFGFPDNLVKALYAAVQMVFAVILRKLILMAVQRKFAFSDPIAIPTDER